MRQDRVGWWTLSLEFSGFHSRSILLTKKWPELNVISLDYAIHSQIKQKATNSLEIELVKFKVINLRPHNYTKKTLKHITLPQILAVGTPVGGSKEFGLISMVFIFFDFDHKEKHTQWFERGL